MVEIKKPQEVLNYLKEKNPKLPFKYIAEIFIEFDERQYAMEAVQKIKNVDDQMPLLIQLGEWKTAVDAAFSSDDPGYYLEQIERNGPSFVRELIRDAQWVKPK